MLYTKEDYNIWSNWLEKFQNENISYEEILNINRGSLFYKYHFEESHERKFLSMYEKAFNDFYELTRIINEINHVELLIDTISLKLEQIYIKENEREKIVEFNNRSWFILAITRVLMLMKEKIELFEKTPKKIRIVSNDMFYGVSPENSDIIEQHITINSDGRVKIFGYLYGNIYRKNKKIQKKDYKIPKEVAKNILEKIVFCFSHKETVCFWRDCGIFEIEIMDCEGEIHYLSSSMGIKFKIDNIDISDLIRDSLGIKELYVFRNNNKGEYYKYNKN